LENNNKVVPAVILFRKTLPSFEKCGWSISDIRMTRKIPDVNQISDKRNSNDPVIIRPIINNEKIENISNKSLYLNPIIFIFVYQGGN
jgi:hypothetical protein